MQNYFDRELSQMEKELLRLKTSQQKFAGSVPTIEKSIQISIPLGLNSSQTVAEGEKLYKIISEGNVLAFPTLAKYYDDITKSTSVWALTRYFTLRLGILDGNFCFLIYAQGTGFGYGQNSDVQTLINGGTVTLQNTLTVAATDDFTLEEV